MPHSSPPETDPSERELRDQAEASTGARVRERRIREIEFRHQGCDRRVRVGEAGPANGAVVLAIFQLGRDAFTIHQRPADHEVALPMVLSHKEVYSVTDFE